MSRSLRFTLVSEGSSDRMLLPVLTWLLSHHFPGYTIQGEWADLDRLPRPPKTLANRIRTGLDLYPCDILFVHRDADARTPEKRIAEVSQAITEAGQGGIQLPVVPVFMSEAWLLFDEKSLRLAAGNSKREVPIKLPPLNRIESTADPKKLLHDLLTRASGLSGRRLKKYRVEASVHRLAELIRDYSPLRELPAFQALERELINRCPLPAS